jgi:hypothetical protein
MVVSSVNVGISFVCLTAEEHRLFAHADHPERCAHSG